MPYLMDRRCDSTIMSTVNMPLDPIRSYLRHKRREGRAVSHMALILTAIVRTVRDFPDLNRFIYNRKYYQHTDFSVAIMVLRDGAEPTMSKIYFDANDDIFTVHRKIEGYINTNRTGEVTNSADAWSRFLVSIPGVAGLVCGIIKKLDKHGLMPRAMIEASPFHATMAISNLVSIHTPRAYHHLYEFGTMSIFMTIGLEQYLPVKTRHGIEMTRCLPLSFTIDERICSGVYFALGFERLCHYLGKPEILEEANDY